MVGRAWAATSSIDLTPFADALGVRLGAVDWPRVVDDYHALTQRSFEHAFIRDTDAIKAAVFRAAMDSCDDVGIVITPANLHLLADQALDTALRLPADADAPTRLLATIIDQPRPPTIATAAAVLLDGLSGIEAFRGIGLADLGQFIADPGAVHALGLWGNPFATRLYNGNEPGEHDPFDLATARTWAKAMKADRGDLFRFDFLVDLAGTMAPHKEELLQPLRAGYRPDPRYCELRTFDNFVPPSQAALDDEMANFLAEQGIKWTRRAAPDQPQPDDMAGVTFTRYRVEFDGPEAAAAAQQLLTDADHRLRRIDAEGRPRAERDDACREVIATLGIKLKKLHALPDGNHRIIGVMHRVALLVAHGLPPHLPRGAIVAHASTPAQTVQHMKTEPIRIAAREARPADWLVRHFA